MATSGVNLQNAAGGGILLQPANTNASNVTINVPQVNDVMVTATTVPAATATTYGGVKFSLVGSVLTLTI